MHCQVKVREWATSLMGTRNSLTKVFIIVLELTDRRGHLVLMIIKRYLFAAQPLPTEE